MRSKRTIRLIGGRAGYNLAVDQAFEMNAHNPGIRYSTELGFFPVSRLVPRGANDVWEWSANYSANSGKRLTPTYSQARELVMLELSATADPDAPVATDVAETYCGVARAEASGRWQIYSKGRTPTRG